MPSIEYLSAVFVETLEQAIDAVVVINSVNDIILYNKSAEKLWGFSYDEVIGKNVKVLVPEHVKPNHDKFINNNRKTGVNKIVGNSRDIEITCKDGSKKWGAFSISKVEVDKKILYTAFVKDVTKEVKRKKQLELLSLVTDKTDYAIVITDQNWEVIYTNDGFSSLFGFTNNELHGKNPIAILVPNFTKSDNQLIREELTAGNPICLDEILQKKQGEKLWCSVMSNPIFNDKKQLTHCVIIINDITKTKLHETLHKQILNAIVHDEPHEQIMEKACNEISRLDHSISPAILKLDGDNLQLLAAPDLPFEYRQVLANLPIGEGGTSSGTAAYRGEKVLVTDIKNDPLWDKYKNKILPFGYTGCLSVPIKNSDSEVIGIVALYYKDGELPNDKHEYILRVITPLCALAIEREKHRENIRQLAYYDALTKLPNRSLLHAKVEQALREANKENQKLAMIFIDVDKFKQVNDIHGHPFGDQLLIEIAYRISPEHSSTDIAGRLSGDEFIVTKNYETQEELHEFIEELRLKVCSPVNIDNICITPSASIGISVFPNDGHDVGTLIHRADMAMYQAKAAGRGRFAYFSHELNQLAQEIQELEIELGKAIKENKLLLYYQPQVSMRDGSIYGVEALARWEHPKFGSVSPSKFIPLAEDCGLINELSLWAIKTACKQMAKWRKQGIKLPTISVNLSPSNFHNMNLCELIVSELELNNLKTSDLTLELTENVLLDTNPSTIKVLHDIHEKGISFSLDDFGTGYSSLSYLRKIPIKELKLDRSFVNEIESDLTSQALSRSVLQIGKSLNLDVVAEGIEVLGQYNTLKEQGYHVAQGYLFSKPLNSVEIEVWLKNSYSTK